MPNIYVTDDTKKLLEKSAREDKRTQDAQINYLCEKRLEETQAWSTAAVRSGSLHH